MTQMAHAKHVLLVIFAKPVCPSHVDLGKKQRKDKVPAKNARLVDEAQKEKVQLEEKNKEIVLLRRHGSLDRFVRSVD